MGGSGPVDDVAPAGSSTNRVAVVVIALSGSFADHEAERVSWLVDAHAITIGAFGGVVSPMAPA